MDPDRLLEYLPQLPERTQYFDSGVLLMARLDPDTYYAGFLTIWREVRTYTELAYSYNDNPPISIDRPANMPPISTFRIRLRASITYYELLKKIASHRRVDESLVRLHVEVAKKCLDYLMLCYIRCSEEDMERYLPDNKDWFREAEQVIRQQIISSHVPQSPPATKATPPNRIDGLLDCNAIVDSMMLRYNSNTDPLTEWDKVLGNEHAKEELYSNMVRALRRNKRVNNVLLFGPPGTGKSMMLKCASRLANCTVFNVTQDVIMQPYQGQSEKIIATMFRRASECQPACIVIDEADHLFARRSKDQSEWGASIRCCLRAAMSRAMEDKDLRLMFIATTTAPEDFDDGFIRRFPCCVYVRLPDRGTIMAIIKQQLDNYELDDDITKLRLHNLATELANKRTLSGYDITRALKVDLRRLLQKSWSTATHFREETLGNGDQVIVPCSSSEPGAFQCRSHHLSEDQDRRLKARKVKMADVERVIRGTVAVTTAAALQRFDAFNREKGMQMF